MQKRILAVMIGGIVALATAVVAIAATITVTPANLNGWAVVHDTCGAATTG